MNGCGCRQSSCLMLLRRREGGVAVRCRVGRLRKAVGTLTSRIRAGRSGHLRHPDLLYQPCPHPPTQSLQVKEPAWQRLQSRNTAGTGIEPHAHLTAAC